MKNKITFSIFVLSALTLCLLSVARASTNIVSSPSTARWAWNDVLAWMDFYITDSVTVLSPGLQGYASSSVGLISLDCATSPAGNICGSSDYQVLNNGAGLLSGWAWSDAVGWISFCGTDATPSDDCPLTDSQYRVQIDPITGDFSGWAWNDVVGWISFNCGDIPDNCATYVYKVQASWTATSTTGYLDSSTFDTGVPGGAQINSVSWQGSMPAPTDGSSVSFQFAASNNPTGPWDYQGPDGTASTYYTTYAPNSPYAVSYTLHNNMRYFRYRMTLASNQTQTSSPRVDSVSVNWSR